MAGRGDPARLVKVDAWGESIEHRATAIVEAVRAERGTVLVIGMQPNGRRGWFGRAASLRELPLVERIMTDVADVDLHLVRMEVTARPREKV